MWWFTLAGATRKQTKCKDTLPNTNVLNKNMAFTSNKASTILNISTKIIYFVPIYNKTTQWHNHHPQLFNGDQLLRDQRDYINMHVSKSIWSILVPIMDFILVRICIDGGFHHNNAGLKSHGFLWNCVIHIISSYWSIYLLGNS